MTRFAKKKKRHFLMKHCFVKTQLFYFKFILIVYLLSIYMINYKDKKT